MKLSVWQFYSIVDAWMRANSSETDSLTAQEKDDLWGWISEGPKEAKGHSLKSRRTVH